MKKLLLTIAVVLLVFSLTGCSADGDDGQTYDTQTEGTQTDGGETVKQDSYTFGYIAYDMTDIWNEYSSYAFEFAAEKSGVETIVLDSKNSLEESVTAMESLIQQGVDGISIFPISMEQGAQLVKMANEAGIPVTIENFAMDIDNPGDYIAAVACEYDQIGYEVIKYIAETQPGAKVFYCAGQEGAGVYEKYQEGVDRALEEVGDKVEIVATLHGDWLTDKAYDVTTDLISSGQEFDYIFANNGMMAQGCYKALEAADMTDIPIISTGGSPDDYEMLVNGIQSANVTAPVSIQGIKTFQHLYDYVVDRKGPDEKFVSLPLIPVSADDLDAFIAWDDYEAAYNYVYDK